MLYFAMGSDSCIYNVGDCGDYEAADESAKDLLDTIDTNITTIWLFDEDLMKEWQERINTWLPTD